MLGGSGSWSLAGWREHDDKDGGKGPEGASCWELRGKEGTEPKWGSSRMGVEARKQPVGVPEPQLADRLVPSHRSPREGQDRRDYR